MAITVRWCTPNDTRLPFVAEHVPDAVVAARTAENRIAIAELNGRPVGAIQLDYLWGTRPYIALIRVDPGVRRQGVGRALLDFVSAMLCDAGHERLYSSSQADEPEPQAWHRHMGFAECGIIAGINPGGIGEVFYVKQLVAAPDRSNISTTQPNDR
jgi:GNAT superfamily N-acetyltransferase